MRWPETPAVDHLALNRFERDVKTLAGEAHDVGFDDMSELRLKLNGIVAACSELLVMAERRAAEQQARIAREELATSIPPVEVGTC